MIDKNNYLAKCWKGARDGYGNSNYDNVKLRLIKKRDIAGRRYNHTTSLEAITLIVRDIGSTNHRDIIVESQVSYLKCINELCSSYLVLQYPYCSHMERVGIMMISISRA